MGKLVTHYRQPGSKDRPACGKGTWVPPSRLTARLTEVTCRDCLRSKLYLDDATATARAIRHELPGQVVLSPGWLPPGGGAAA